MKITDLEIDGFGVWHDLKLKNLSPRVTAFYGANEAGKTTLMHFVRTVLYGASPARRRRYLPPLEGGRPGGVLGITDGDVRFRAARFADRGDDDLGRVVCTSSGGQESGDRPLREALSDVDEVTFNNIFAIGLREIQELGTLSDTRAAQWLYRLTSGIDRVSLFDVIQQLRATRNELLSDDQTRPARIVELSNRRDVLRAEIDRLMQQNRGWSQIAVRIAELDGQIEAAEQQVRNCEHRARTVEIAVGLKDNWRKRIKLSEQIEQFVGRVQLPTDAISRLDEINQKIEQHQRQADVLQGQRHQLRDEAERLGINELLVRNCCRIDALGEQRDWLDSLGRQMVDLETSARQYENRLSSEQQRLSEALGLARGDQLKEITEEDLDELHPQIERIRAAQKKVDAAQRHHESLNASERSLKTQIESAIIGGEQHGLPMDLQEASDLVAKLRKRLQVEQRIEQARQHELDMEQQSHELLDDQVMPLWLFGWLLATFVIGSFMLGVWALVPDSPFGKFGGLVAVLGIGAAAFSWIFKYFAEDAAADRLDACQRQLDVLARQISDAEREKEGIDAELPLADGSVVLRLQAAERHLAELENLLPVEAQRKRAGNDAADAETRVGQARRELQQALEEWKTTVAALGLPESLDPQRLLKVTDRYGQLSELQSRARQRRDDAAARQREHAALLRRIREISEEVGLQYETEQTEPLEQLDNLLSESRRQLADVEHRNELRERAKLLKQDEGKHRRAIVGLHRRKTALFETADCADEQEYRMLAADLLQASRLATQRDAVSREIAAAIGRHEPEVEFAELLGPDQIGALDQRWEVITAELEQLQATLKQLAEQRGSLGRQQQALAEDQTLAERQLDFDVVQRQLAQARQSWREHAVVNRVLERIRADYEAHRQPETLAEASRYMSQLTDGKYRRIWTPLANDILLVENREGDALPVDVLSRGAREQLYLSVRLALVSTFARRGVNLPMVLDDVLVNFDAERAQRAAQVLCQFAAGGHQLLVFTCHEHMWKMFQTLDADCRRLPVRGQSATVEPQSIPAPEPVVIEATEVETVEEVEEVVEPSPRPKKRKPRQRAPAPVEPEPVPPTPREDFYDYPFVERLVEQRVEEPPAAEDVATEIELTPMAAPACEYSFADQQQPPTQDHALAYIVGSDANYVGYPTDATEQRRRRPA